MNIFKTLVYIELSKVPSSRFSKSLAKTEKKSDVKNERSGLNIFYFFSFSFYFLFDLFSFILFLEPGLGLE